MNKSLPRERALSTDMGFHQFHGQQALPTESELPPQTEVSPVDTRLPPQTHGSADRGLPSNGQRAPSTNDRGTPPFPWTTSFPSQRGLPPQTEGSTSSKDSKLPPTQRSVPTKKLPPPPQRARPTH